MRSWKNTEQFYGIFYVHICGNICGALITAKKYDNICCRKKYWNFLRYFLRKYFQKYLWCLKYRKKYNKIFRWKTLNFFLHFLRKYLRKYFCLYKHPQLVAQNFWKIYFLLKNLKKYVHWKKNVKFYDKIYNCKKFLKKFWYYLQS